MVRGRHCACTFKRLANLSNSKLNWSGLIKNLTTLKISAVTIILLFNALAEGFRGPCSLEFDGCEVEFHFSIDITVPVLIENSDEYSCPTSSVPWIIAGSLVGAILLLGLLALIILKICLVFLVSIMFTNGGCFTCHLLHTFCHYVTPTASVLPYSRKIWRGIKFGSLVV